MLRKVKVCALDRLLLDLGGWRGAVAAAAARSAA